MKKIYTNLFHRNNKLKHLKFDTILYCIQYFDFFHKIVQLFLKLYIIIKYYVNLLFFLYLFTL